MYDVELEKLFLPVTSLYGVNDSVCRNLEKLLGGNEIKDLLFHLPAGGCCRKKIDDLSDVCSGDAVVFKIKVIQHQSSGKFKTIRQPYRVYGSVGDNMVSLVFFNANTRYLNKLLLLDNTYIVAGKIELYKGQWQVTHPDHIGNIETMTEWVGYKPYYPLASGIVQKNIQKLVKWSLQQLPQVPEWLSSKTLQLHHDWYNWSDSIKKIHNPLDDNDLSANSVVRSRLAYDELFANQLALQLVRHNHSVQKGSIKLKHGVLYDKAISHLPFELTMDQLSALQVIASGLASADRMNRLLQGDVGSGKTIVAFLASLIAIENNYQVAFMAPTEILATQHYNSIKALADAVDIKIEILTGKDSKVKKERVYKQSVNGEIDILLGTHSLIQEGLAFKNLGFVVIDEQHRFGVGQRLALTNKGANVDCLSMTATPIPRTLMLAAYGDLDTIQLHQKPKERKTVQTKTISLDRLLEVVEGIKRAIDKGDKIYWVCPLVEESELINLAAVEERFNFLSGHLGDKVGFLHGKMKPKEKNDIMRSFVDGKIRVLVATTVIEVGVDVKDATIMVIEHAECFGLAQLHQLRGRIGRGDKDATCILLYDAKLSTVGQSRLQIIKNSNDGFAIAEEDWKIRGGGEFLGLKQSGLPNFRFVDWSVHKDLLREAVIAAKELVELDPLLSKTEQGRAAKCLLRLFDKDETISYISAG